MVLPSFSTQMTAWTITIRRMDVATKCVSIYEKCFYVVEQNECTKVAILTFWKIVLEIPFSTDEITFLDLCLYKGERFAKEGILDIKTHIKPTNTQQYVHASSAHPPGTGRGIIKGELLRYLRTNSNEAMFQTHKEKHVQNI